MLCAYCNTLSQQENSGSDGMEHSVNIQVRNGGGVEKFNNSNKGVKK
jgi:hypothetical protein